MIKWSKKGLVAKEERQQGFRAPDVTAGLLALRDDGEEEGLKERLLQHLCLLRSFHNTSTF